MATAEVAVVGAGINGLATAHALARQGHDVVVYEQFELGHTRGSSHGRSRIFRLACPEARWVRLGIEALEGWRALEAESGEELLVLNGLLAPAGMRGKPADPDEENCVPDDETVQEIVDWTNARFRNAGREPLHAETCFYTTTDDERFILERHGRIVVGSACSGHGFKFAPAVGARLAALAVEALS